MIIKSSIIHQIHGLISPDNNYSLIPILKNGNNWTKRYLSQGWSWRTCPDRDQLVNPKLKILTTLRDPLSRWYSGMAQFYFNMRLPISESYFDDDYVVFQIFDTIKFDQHHELQSNFLEGVDTDNCVFFFMDSNFEKNFKKYCHNNLGGKINDYIPKNGSSDSPTKLLVISKLKKIVENNPDLKYKILNYYQKDYELIESVQFYGKKSN